MALMLAADNFYNTDSATISANDITISTNSFVNTHTRGDGNINADTLSLSLIGDFDYAMIICNQILTLLSQSTSGW